ncbi:MAG: hypothetical protein RLZZ457_217 [Pseudomonadota bacterium]|jgi:hypothetical protein
MSIEKKLTVEVVMDLPHELSAYLSQGLLGMKLHFYWRASPQPNYVKSPRKHIHVNLSADELDALMNLNQDHYEH